MLRTILKLIWVNYSIINFSTLLDQLTTFLIDHAYLLFLIFPIALENQQKSINYGILVDFQKKNSAITRKLQICLWIASNEDDIVAKS